MNFQELKNARNQGALPLWILVPIVSLGGTALAYAIDIFIIGTIGCFLGSIILAVIAYLKPRRDIVSLLTPMYALIIFLGLETPPTTITQGLYAASITILAIRLEKRFSEPTEPKPITET